MDMLSYCFLGFLFREHAPAQGHPEQPQSQPCDLPFTFLYIATPTTAANAAPTRVMTTISNGPII